MKTPIKVSLKLFYESKLFYYFLDFSIKRNTKFSTMNIIFLNDTRYVIFKCIFSEENHFWFCDGRIVTYLQGKSTIFTAYTENIKFPCIFIERLSFIFRLMIKIIFPGKRNTIFSYNTKKIIFQCDLFGKTIFLEYLEK